MSTDARFAALVTISLFILSTLMGIMGYMIRAAIRVAQTESKVTELVTDVAKLVESKERDHQKLAQGLRDIYDQSDRRLRWLEENTWKRAPRSRDNG